MNSQDLQAIISQVAVIAQAAAAAFDPKIGPTIALATSIAERASMIVDIINGSGADVDQTALEAQVKALHDKVMAHADQTIAALGDDEAASDDDRESSADVG